MQHITKMSYILFSMHWHLLLVALLSSVLLLLLPRMPALLPWVCYGSHPQYQTLLPLKPPASRTALVLLFSTCNKVNKTHKLVQKMKQLKKNIFISLKKPCIPFYTYIFINFNFHYTFYQPFQQTNKNWMTLRQQISNLQKRSYACNAESTRS